MKIIKSNTISKKITLIICLGILSNIILYMIFSYTLLFTHQAGFLVRGEREYTITVHSAVTSFNNYANEKKLTDYEKFTHLIKQVLSMSDNFAYLPKKIAATSLKQAATELNSAFINSLDYNTSEKVVNIVLKFKKQSSLVSLLIEAGKATKLGQKYLALSEKFYTSDSEKKQKKIKKEMDKIAEKILAITTGFSQTVHEFSIWMKKTTDIIMFVIICLTIIINISIGRFYLKRISLSINSATDDITYSAKELHENSQKQLLAVSTQASAVTEINAIMQELVATSSQLEELSGNTTTLSNDTKNAVIQGKISLSKAKEGIENIQIKVKKIAADMLALGEKSQEIGVVLDVINELSQQVTVLSYNATIEAFGAGEKGKRFMAVADRIIKLAEKSVDSAKEVKFIISAIQNDSNKTIMSTEDGIKAVETGIANADEVEVSLENIDKYTAKVLGFMGNINNSIQQQHTGVEQAASEVDAVYKLLQETENNSRQVVKTADKLIGMSNTIKNI